MELRKGGDSIDWFFLAMSRWQLGDKEAARKWYDQSVEWMAKNKPNDKELIQFRGEAAELLGVAEASAGAVEDGKREASPEARSRAVPLPEE